MPFVYPNALAGPRGMLQPYVRCHASRCWAGKQGGRRTGMAAKRRRHGGFSDVRALQVELGMTCRGEEWPAAHSAESRKQKAGWKKQPRRTAQPGRGCFAMSPCLTHPLRLFRQPISPTSCCATTHTKPRETYETAHMLSDVSLALASSRRARHVGEPLGCGSPRRREPIHKGTRERTAPGPCAAPIVPIPATYNPRRRPRLP